MCETYASWKLGISLDAKTINIKGAVQGCYLLYFNDPAKKDLLYFNDPDLENTNEDIQLESLKAICTSICYFGSITVLPNL